MRRFGVAVVAVLIAFGGVALVPAVTAGAAEADGSDVSVVRHEGPDRYATSLEVAEAVAADAGGSLEWVVLVSGERWTDAVVAAPVAGALGAPVLMTPPGELRSDALRFLQRVGVSQALVVGPAAGGGGHGPGRGVSAGVLTALGAAGISAERVAGADRYGTAVAAAGRVTPGAMGDLGRTAVIANGEKFADALVAGPFAARGIHPVLLTPPGVLHASVASYLRDNGIEHVVLMGGTAALSQAVEQAVVDLGIEVSRMAGSTRFDTAVKAAKLAAGRYSTQAGTRCFANDTIGVARARVPYDSFSAAPLLGRLCAPLLLADPDRIPPDTAAYIDTARQQHNTVGLQVFGGGAAVSKAAINAYLTGDDSDSAVPVGVLPAGPCGGTIYDEPRQLLPSVDAHSAAWSPDCSRLVYIEEGECHQDRLSWCENSLWTVNNDGTDARKLLDHHHSTGLESPVWSPDGTRIAYTRRDIMRSLGRRGSPAGHIWTVNVDGSNNRQVTTGDVIDTSPSWSPDSDRIAFGRSIFGDVRDTHIVVMRSDGTQPRALNAGGQHERLPAWSPDGTQIAYVSHEILMVSDTDGNNERPVIGRVAGEGLSWSPDGTRIALVRDEENRESASRIIIRVDGGDVEEILHSVDAGDGHITRWSPDGQLLAFDIADRYGKLRINVAGVKGEPVEKPVTGPTGPCGGNIDDGPRQLLPFINAKYPAWSPDCTRLVYIHEGACRVDAIHWCEDSLWTVNNDGTDARKLLDHDRGTWLEHPVWSPDGTRVAYARGIIAANSRRSGGTSHIWTVNADGSNKSQLTAGDVVDTGPAWSPDSKQIAFARDIGYDLGWDSYIVVMMSDGTVPRVLNTGGAPEAWPAWSPDGTQLAYVSNGFLMVSDTDGNNTRLILGGLDQPPSWSPDGTRIAFARSDARKSLVGTVDIDGTSEEEIVHELPRDKESLGEEHGYSSPRWSPDGQLLAFSIEFSTYVGDGRTRMAVIGADGQPAHLTADCRPLSHGQHDVTTGFPLPDEAPSATSKLRVAVLFMDFPDAQAAHTTQEEAALGLPWAEEYLEAASYGRLDVEFVPHHIWLRAEQAHNAYIVPFFDPVKVSVPASYHVVELADPGFDFADMDAVMTVFPSTHFAGGGNAGGGFGSADGVTMATSRVNDTYRSQEIPLDEAQPWGFVAAHELAHNLGLADLYPHGRSGHDSVGQPTAPGGRDWVPFNLGLMQLGTSFLADRSLMLSSLRSDEMLAWSRWQLGWLRKNQVRCVAGDAETVALAPIDRPGGAIAMAALPISRHRIIVIESRRELDLYYHGGQEPAISTDGVVVYVVETLIDTLPVRFAGDNGNGFVDRFPLLQAGESISVLGNTITVTADDGDTHTVAITRGN